MRKGESFFSPGAVRRGKGLYLLLSLVLVLLLGCALGERVDKLRRRHLTIVTDPAGALVFVNGVYQGKTPISLEYRLGLADIYKGLEVSLEKKGYVPTTRLVDYGTKRLFIKMLRQRRRPATSPPQGAVKP